MKLNIYLKDANSFLNGDTYNGLDILSTDDIMDDFVQRHGGKLIQTIEIADELFVHEDMVKSAIADLDKAEKAIRAEAEAKVADIQRRKSELLAIEYKPS